MKSKFNVRVVLISILIVIILIISLFASSVLNISNLNILSLFTANVGNINLIDSSTFPVRIKIPKINVDAVVESVGFTSDLAMDVPKLPANSGWFKLGVQPGEKGSAVIAGHFGWKNGIPAVFDNLHKLRKGDIVYIENNKGMAITFVVKEIKIFKMDDDASDIFFSRDGGVHLNLITCSGAWNKVAKTSSERLVVFLDEDI
jgi:LPXTG-site transpeptidase (sortase) family protein